MGAPKIFESEYRFCLILWEHSPIKSSELVKLCAQLLSDKPLFFLINSYTTGLAPAVLTYMLSIEVKSKFGGSVISDEIGLPVAKNGLILPCGASGRWSADE